jgi:hypothetical protein
MTRPHGFLHLSSIMLVILIHYFIVKVKTKNEHQLNLQQLLSLKQFCETAYNDTIEPEIQPIMCPRFVPNSPSMLCPRLFDSNINFSNPLLSSLYADTKLHWQHLLNKFKKHLGDRVVFFLGDSLKKQMLTQLKCLEVFTAVSVIHHIHDSALSGFPTQLNSSLYNFSRHVDIYVAERAFRQEWYYHIRGNNRIKYLVINTGMWWNPDYFIYLNNHSLVHNTDEMLDFYRDYFHRDGLLLTRLYDLIHNYNVTVLWRDTSPAGSCTADNIKYHTSISTMNMIAQSSLSEIGVVIIPGIWEESLPYWKHHFSEAGSKGYKDLVHYCAFQNQSVMNIWIRNTITTILEN